MKNLLKHFNLGDAYEIQARVCPAMLVVLPIALLAVQVEWKDRNWLGVVGWGSGLEIVLAVFVSKLGHALGARLQKNLERDWGGLPTNRWLRPSDCEHSEQQKNAWRHSLLTLTGLDIQKVVDSGDTAEIDRIINDAVVASRNKIRGNRKAALVQKYNVAFGFARNLAGLRWVALAVCLVCLAASLYGVFWRGFPAGAAIVHALLLLVAAFYAWLAVGYVQHCAVRYAEFFYAAATAIAGTGK